MTRSETIRQLLAEQEAQAATIFGVAAAEGDIATKYDRHGRFTAESFDTLITKLPIDGVAVDIEHRGVPVGAMIFGEITDNGALGVVTVIEDGDALVSFDDPIWFSPTFLTLGEGVHTRAVAIADSAALRALSLTTNPATIGARPVTVLAGDVRSSFDRSRWPIGWQGRHPLLGRALDHLGSKPERCVAQRLVDVRAQDPAYEYRYGRPPGQLRHGSPGKVLAVR